jgi:octanoyl-[GcvH]:protein N-octanoyltransferase
VDAGADERGSQVRARVLSLTQLRVLDDCFPDDPALDTAVSRAIMRRVAAGELPETLRLARPAAVVAFAKRDAVAPGYAEAVAAARAHGFGAILRLAGGRAAIFHEGTLELAHAVPDPDPRAGIRHRFETTAELIARALRRLGVEARVGEVPGEYCPGRWSVNAAGARKLAGVGQRVIAGGSHTGAVVVVEDAERVRATLEPVYRALRLDWDPDTVGAVAQEAPVDWSGVREALLGEYAERYELAPGELDEETMALARRLAPEHSPPVPA